jgi:hypothetical protein
VVTPERHICGLLIIRDIYGCTAVLYSCTGPYS